MLVLGGGGDDDKIHESQSKCRWLLEGPGDR